MFDVLHGLRGKILALCLGSLTLLGLTMGAAGVYAVMQAAAEAHDLLTQLTGRPQHYIFNDIKQSFTISLGYVSYPDQAQGVSELMRTADAALYATKLKGKNGFSRYAAEQEQVDRAKLSFSLRDISQNLPGAILVCKATDGQILYANDALVRLCGCDGLDDFMAYTRGAFPYLLDPAGRTQAQAEIRARTATADDHKASIRCRIRTKENRLQPVRAITRLKSSPYHGAVYYAVIVEEEGG